MSNNLSLAFAALNIILGRCWICSAVDVPNIAKYFGTKGRYEEVNPNLLDDKLNVKQTNVEPPSPSCRAVHITATLRHGTRYPTKKYIQFMENIHRLVSEKKAEWFRDPKPQMVYTADEDGRLTEKGRADHKHLAVRLAKSFPTLISKENLLNGRFKFITSSKHRCVDSMEAFKEGLAHHWKTKEFLKDHAKIDDELMRFFDHCKNQISDKTARTEEDLFKLTSEMRDVCENVERLLEVKDHPITAELAEAAFLLCAYDFAIRNEDSPLCRLFEEKHAQVLEYLGDLKQYRKSHIYQKSSCSLFLDLFSRLDRVASSKSQVTEEAFTVQMGHAETLMPLLTLLGFFEGGLPLKSSNYAQQHDRTFRTSHIMPYAANLVWVLYSCPEGPRLQVLLNEKPEYLPKNLQHAPLYDTVKQAYQQLRQDCQTFKKEC